MIKVKQLYVVVNDEDCHNYLIPKDQYLKFTRNLEQAERRLESYIDEAPLQYQEDDYINELQQLVWDCYEGYDRLEGEQYYVVKLEDVEE